MDCLALSHAYEPVRRYDWQRALRLLCKGEVEVVEEYEDKVVHSASQEWKVPSIIRFLKETRRRKKMPKFSRESIYARDHGKCCYCDARVARDEFTFDHVVPRSQGGTTTWGNVVCACGSCNQRKGGKTPEQAKMTLLRKPFKPTAGQVPQTLLFHMTWQPGMPEAWATYLRSGVYWRGSLEEEK